MNLGKKAYLAAALLLILFTTFSYPQAILTIGSAAPALKYSKWLKGTPVKKIEKGRIYVVEFWATWCSPCRESMPHISAIARRYKNKAVVIGMDVWEKGEWDNNKSAAAYVKQMGNKMDYNVAADTEDKYMAVKWLEAAAQNGIPAAFIIDKESKIAWIGHPIGIDEPLAKIVEGTYDGKEYAVKLLEEQKNKAGLIAQNKIFNEKGKDIADAAQAKDYKRVIEECDKLFAAEPSLKTIIDGYYLQAYINTNSDKAFELADKAVCRTEMDFLMYYLFPFLAKNIDKRFYDYAINYCNKSLAKNRNNADVLYILSIAYERAGDREKLIDTLEKLLSASREQKISEEDLKSYIDKLNELRGAKS